MTATADHVSTTVIDNPTYAWRNVADPVKTAWYAQLDNEDFVDDHRAVLDQTATRLFGPLLTQTWHQHGYQVTPVPDGLVMQRRPKGFPHHHVWDQACRALDPYAVVTAAGLDRELQDYAAHRPHARHLECALAGLAPHLQAYRGELHARLDDLTVGTLRDEHRIEGWRHLVDTATTRAQLDQLAHDIPA